MSRGTVRLLLSCMALVAILVAGPARANDLPVVYEGAPPETEFNAPYAIRVLPGGAEVEISGSFSQAVPGDFAAVLAGAPQVRAVRLESPGGYVQPALTVADIIRTRGLDTYVGRFCASACTLAFLGGQHRYVAPDARLGFHQASASGVAQVRVDSVMRQAYGAASVPAAFIDHVLRTPPEALWFPSRDELVETGVASGPPPTALVIPDSVLFQAWADAVKDLRWASDEALVQFATTTVDLLEPLQGAGSEICWDFTHDVPVDIETHVQAGTLVALKAALQHVRDDVKEAPTVRVDAADKAGVLAALVQTLPEAAQNPTAAALRQDADPAAFCPALRSMLAAALALPVADRDPALRALLSGGS
ncbi:hypothetical protein [Acidisphaera sp. S103]|uniref:COG3904 family protein n=1 Tax=Acidisphaera sp. S103 TaxID=1747223 RepID=UPI00131D9717|nr:hypothetical protein [Acidisphaera sp. S103]